ncbi:cytochrome P450 2U1 isoform X3 [Stegostoma tigrinum]|uniref:cytochrome P450 2U1 isoform X3 n=1 Tax=Stegostoma tigrinum TaxID=3053191 RepID=UPI00202B0B3F|nr:cytochrome P450 2U1 isoform X3 [Stegostoma tigrinum]XP_059506618.1 cytochrome P450 2U1 isoform X3 [Stegostoma tigrinum]
MAAGPCHEAGQTPRAGQYMTSIFLGFAVLLLSRYLLKRRAREQCRLPPGPPCWPLIGLLLSLVWRPGSGTRLPPHLYFTALGKTYGEICRLYLGRQLIIILNGFHMVRDALQHHAEVFSDRPTIPLITIITKRKGIVFAPYGLVWKQQRKFSLSTLRYFGFGKLDLEPKIIEELQFVKSEFSSAVGTAFSPSHVIHNAVSNIICSMCFGKRFDYDDEEFRTMLNLIVQGMKLASNSPAMLINVIPLFQYLPFGPFKEVVKTVRDVTAFLKNIIDQHQKTMDPENPRDFVDFYLKEIDYQRHKKQNTSFSEDYLFYIIGDLFVAGTDTTSNTLLWAILFMAVHPEVQAPGFWKRQQCCRKPTELPSKKAAMPGCKTLQNPESALRTHLVADARPEDIAEAAEGSLGCWAETTSSQSCCHPGWMGSRRRRYRSRPWMRAQ